MRIAPSPNDYSLQSMWKKGSLESGDSRILNSFPENKIKPTRRRVGKLVLGSRLN
jgi:hypothetical protein